MATASGYGESDDEDEDNNGQLGLCTDINQLGRYQVQEIIQGNKNVAAGKQTNVGRDLTQIQTQIHNFYFGNQHEEQDNACDREGTSRTGNVPNTNRGRQSSRDVGIQSKSQREDCYVLDFNLDSVRRQLMQEYKDTRGKLHLLPGMPEESANMEDLFVDLQIIEENKKPTGVEQRWLKSCDELVSLKKNGEGASHHNKEDEVIKRLLVKGRPGAGKSTTISKLAYDWACNKQWCSQNEGVKTQTDHQRTDITSIFRLFTNKILGAFSPPGQSPDYATESKPDSPLDYATGSKPDLHISKFELLFAIAINEINTDADLIDIIQDQLLPKVPRRGLEEYIQSNASSVIFLLDGYDEASEYFHKCKDITNVLCSKWLQESCVIVTTRQNKVADFVSRYKAHYTQVEVRGFTEENRNRYIANFFCLQQRHLNCESSVNSNKTEKNGRERDKTDNVIDINVEKFIESLKYSPRLRQLSNIPIILSMLCLLWKDDQKLPTGVTSLYKDLIMLLASHKFSKANTPAVNYDTLQIWVDGVMFDVGQVAINGLFKDNLIFPASTFSSHHLEEACLLGIVTKERKRSRASVSSHVTFLHKTFQEICAAVYWVKLSVTDRKQFDSYLGQITEDNVDSMEILLRFTCGLSFEATEMILAHVVGLMCKKGAGMFNYSDDFIHRFRDEVDIFSCKNFYQQFPLSLVYEAETNSGREKAQRLHKLLQPLYNIVFCEIAIDDYFINEEFKAMIDFYTSSQVSDIVEDTHGQSWLTDVEQVVIRQAVVRHDGYTHMPAHRSINEQYYHTVVKMLCNMPNLTILRISLKDDKYQTSVLTNLITNKFTGKFINELHMKGIIADSSQWVVFISNMPVLSKLVLHTSIVTGVIPDTVSWASLKEFNCAKCNFNSAQWVRLISSMPALGKLKLERCEITGTQTTTITCTSLQELHCHYCHFNAATWLWLTSSMPALSKLSLESCEIESGMTNMPALPYLEHLKLESSQIGVSYAEKLFNGFIEEGERSAIQSQKMDDSAVALYVTNDSGLALTTLDLTYYQIGDSVEKLAHAYQHMTHLKHLKLGNTGLNATQSAILFDAFIDVGQKMQNKRVGALNDGNEISNACQVINGLPLEELILREVKLFNSVIKLAHAYQYMTHLKHLDLFCSGLTVTQTATLFDAFIDLGEKMQQNEWVVNDSSEVSGASKDFGLPLEKLSLGYNDIGGSMVKFTQAYKYMPHLTHLNLRAIQVTPLQGMQLFNGFIEAGKSLQQQGEGNIDTYGNMLSTSQSGLRIEELDLSHNMIVLKKHLQAFTYMPHLKYLNLNKCLSLVSKDAIGQVLQNINPNFQCNCIDIWTV